jgi:hypothetical protein
MNEKQYQALQKNKHFVIGLLGLCEGHRHFIHFIDTRIRGHHFAHHIIECYSMYQNYCIQSIFPQEILDSAAGYWAKWFERIHNIKSADEVVNLVKRMKPRELEWNGLVEFLKKTQ